MGADGTALPRSTSLLDSRPRGPLLGTLSPDACGQRSQRSLNLPRQGNEGRQPLPVDVPRQLQPRPLRLRRHDGQWLRNRVRDDAQRSRQTSRRGYEGGHMKNIIPTVCVVLTAAVLGIWGLSSKQSPASQPPPKVEI